MITDGRKLRGNLKIGGFNLPLNGVQPVAGDSTMPEYRKRFSNPGMLEDGLPLDLRVRTTGSTLVGSLSRPDPAYAELSFTMDAVDLGGRADAVRAGLDESMAARFETVPSIKNKGVPTSTSIVNLKRGEKDG